MMTNSGQLKNGWSIIITVGDMEPWYFLEGWERQIKEHLTFDNKEEAIHAFVEIVKSYRKRFHFSKTKGSSIACFWNEGDEVYCDACDEYVQVFHGILLFYHNHLFQPNTKDKNIFALLESTKMIENVE